MLKAKTKAGAFRQVSGVAWLPSFPVTAGFDATGWRDKGNRLQWGGCTKVTIIPLISLRIFLTFCHRGTESTEVHKRWGKPAEMVDYKLLMAK